MSNALNRLIQLLTLTPLGNGQYQGESEDLGLPQVFGGQVMAQSIAAAMAVVPEERHLHACQAYFLRAGSAKQPIVYETEILREGNSFTVVSVSAKQNDEMLLRLTASFQINEQGFDFQEAMTITNSPSDFHSENEIMAQIAAKVPDFLRPLFENERAFDVRLKYPNNPFKGAKLPAEQQLWVKTTAPAANKTRLQQCILAYFSDFHCISTMLHPFECGVFEQKVRFATLEHHLYFHRPFDLNEWTLFQLASRSATGARGLADGKVYNQAGELVASYSQEALIRPL